MGLGDPGTVADYQGWKKGREQLKEARKDRGWRMGESCVGRELYGWDQ